MSGTVGKVGVRVLGAGADFTEIGFDAAAQSFYADHSKCCGAAAANTVVQRAKMPLGADGGLSVSVFVDGGLVEAFANDLVAITPMVSPAAAAGPAAARTNVAFAEGFAADAAPECRAESWQLQY